MEADKRYFLEGLFVIGLALGAVLFFLWLGTSGHHDDRLYRIHFEESVSGLSLGEPVKFQGVDVGIVKTMAVDSADPGRVVVDVTLAREAPVRTDTKASLKLKGITGVVYIELEGGSPEAPSLLAATPPGRIPEITAEKSSLATVLDRLPELIDKFAAFENKANRVATDVGQLTAQLKRNPSLLLRRPPKEPAPEAGAEAPPPSKPPRPMAGHP